MSIIELFLLRRREEKWINIRTRSTNPGDRFERCVQVVGEMRGIYTDVLLGINEGSGGNTSKVEESGMCVCGRVAVVICILCSERIRFC